MPRWEAQLFQQEAGVLSPGVATTFLSVQMTLASRISNKGSKKAS